MGLFFPLFDSLSPCSLLKTCHQLNFCFRDDARDNIKLDPAKVSDVCTVISIMPSFFGTASLKKRGKKTFQRKGTIFRLGSSLLGG